MESNILKSIYRNSNFTQYEPYEATKNYQITDNYEQTSTYVNTGNNYNQTYFNTESQNTDINNANLINELVTNNSLNNNVNYTPNYSNYSNIDSNMNTNYSNFNTNYTDIANYSNINSNYLNNNSNYIGYSNVNEGITNFSNINENIVNYSNINENILNYSNNNENIANYSNINENVVNYSNINEGTANYLNINENIPNYSNVNENVVNYSNVNENIGNYSNINTNTTNYNEYFPTENTNITYTNYQSVIQKEIPTQNLYNILPVKYLQTQVMPSNQKQINIKEVKYDKNNKDIKEFATVLPIKDIVKIKKTETASKKVKKSVEQNITKDTNKIPNKNVLINSPVVYKDQSESNDFLPYLHKSPKVSNKLNILSPINSPLLNYETQSFNVENEFDIDEFFRLKEENEMFKEKLKELDRYKAEAAEARELKQQVEALSPLREQVAEMASLKAQLEELNELKAKVAELEKLRLQVENLEYTKEEEKKIYQLDEQKGKKYLEESQDILNINNDEIDDKEDKKDKEDKEEKEEKTFVKGDIIQSIDELELLIRKINKDSDKITLNLLYKATADSDRAKVFHKKCDKAKNTLVFIETDKGKRFGGYTSVTWKGKSLEKYDEESFVFSLDKMKIYENIQGEKAIGCYPKYGPVFLGCQIRIYDHAFTRGGTTFEKGVNFNTEQDFELTGGDRVFNVKDIEVYEVIPQ